MSETTGPTHPSERDDDQEPDHGATTPGPHLRRRAAARAGGDAPDSGTPDGLPVPERIGTLRILRSLGEGGMGVVYEGEQQSPRRRVAIKLMRADAWSAGLVSRFRREAELLGRLEHPGIARVYEAGHARPWGSTGPELPYLVMEFVDGAPITTHAQRLNLDPHQRLALIGLVCDAVQHAHERGVIHRDLKPANVLVDVTGQPRVLDFGVARALDPDVQPLTAHTGTSQLVGTLPYMSPEQISGRPGAVGPRSDVYSLGVLAYELLSGRRPVQTAGLPLAEAVRQVQDVDPPRLGDLDRRLSGDIEAIVGKALEKEPERRYASAAEMSADIGRFLGEQPILARPQSAIYRATKFVRRNTAIVVAMASLVIVLIAGIAATSWMALRESRARVEADRSADRARRLSYQSALAAALAAIQGSNAHEARAHLDAAPPELREWTWRHLRSRLDDATSSLELGPHSGERSAQMIVRDDGRIAVPLQDGIAIVRIEGERLVRDLSLSGRFVVVSADGHRALEHVTSRWIDRSLDEAPPFGMPKSLDLGPAGDPRALPLHRGGWLLSAPASDGASALRAVDALGTELAALALRFDGPTTVSPDDRFLATMSGDRLVAADLTQGGRVTELGPRASAVAFTPDGKLLVAIDREGKGSSWRVPGFAPGPWRDVAFATAPIAILATDAGGERLITVDVRGTARSWRLDDASLERELAELGYFHHVLAIPPDGAPRVVMAESAGGLRTVHLDARGEQWTALGATPPIASVAVLSGGRGLLALERSGSLRLFVSPERSPSRRLLGHESYVYDVAIDNGGRVASISWDGTARVWDAVTGAQLQSVALPDRVGRVVAMLPGGTLVTATNGVTSAWDLETGREVGRLDSEPRVRGFAPLEAAGRVAFASEEGRLGWWEPRSGASGIWRTLDPVPGKAPQLAVNSPLGILAWAFAGDVGVIAIPSGEERWRSRVDCPNVLDVDLDAAGARIAASCSDGSIALLDAKDGGNLTWLARATGTPVYAARFHPAGGMLATGAQDGSITTWDCERGERIATLRDHRDYVHALAFSPDGRRLVSGSADGTVGVWTAEP